MALVEREQLGDVDVGEPVAVGDDESLVRRRTAAPACTRPPVIVSVAGVDDRDRPVGLAVVVVVLDLRGAPEADREVVGARLVVEEVVA